MKVPRRMLGTDESVGVQSTSQTAGSGEWGPKNKTIRVILITSLVVILVASITYLLNRLLGFAVIKQIPYWIGLGMVFILVVVPWLNEKSSIQPLVTVAIPVLVLALIVMICDAPKIKAWRATGTTTAEALIVPRSDKIIVLECTEGTNEIPLVMGVSGWLKVPDGYMYDILEDNGQIQAVWPTGLIPLSNREAWPESGKIFRVNFPASVESFTLTVTKKT